MFMKACLDDEAVGGIVVGLALFFLFLSVSLKFMSIIRNYTFTQTIDYDEIKRFSVGHDSQNFEIIAWKERCQINK